MKNKKWCNTMLVAFSSLPKIVNFIDFSVKSRVKSGFQSKHMCFGVQNEELYQSIINLNDEKRRICNMKFIVEQAMNQLSPTHFEVLKLRFFEKKTFQEIADQTGVVLRTVFRRYDKAIKDFEDSLDSVGFTEEWLDNEYKDIAILSTIKKRLENDCYLTKATIE